MDKTSKTILMIFLFILIYYILYLLSSLLLPLVLALLFSILFQPLILLLRKIKIPKWLILPTVSIITLLIIYGLFSIIINTSTEIASQKDYLLMRLDLRLNELLNWFNTVSGLNINSEEILTNIEELLDTKLISTTVGSVASSVGSFTGSFFMFSLYYIVLLSGMADYKKYLEYVAGDFQDTKFVDNFEKIQKSVYQYMIIKALISLTTGTMVFLICLIFGIKFPIFWGLLMFILHFIPNIGSIIATIPPVLMGIIQFDSINMMALLLIFLAGVQIIMGNIVEPKIMGDRLQLNTVTVIFGLVFWGYIWGIPGMMLSVPLLVIFKLVLEHIPSLSILARIMGSPQKEIVKT